ncbi:MAG: MarR family transcriptional regulator [Flavobacteriales bacterium]|nr:MarR family transcriptional regulator [Flavobacteriales bacterium]
MQDIKLEEVLFFHIEKMMRSVKDHTLMVFKEHNFPVTKDQWVILKRISDEDASTQKDIAASTFKDPAALTRILDLLEQKKLVKRQGSASDRRSFEISLTVDGRRLVNRMIPVVQKIRAKAMQGISKQEEKQAREIMSKMHLNFE